ncbi:MAG TPA: 3-deoxy-manno-octulosonate cytidylyltransferase [candidate division Zixibacteria bacterium]|nr:3-deoxy-manno-octulosonate cytidylyltransferase [candidate division Zixibacteria bacterium]
MAQIDAEIWAIIPARFASTRLPGKPLADVAEKPLIRWAWEAASGADVFSRTIIATDDERIASTASGFGAEVVMTSPEHASGTDRIAEVVLSTTEEHRPDFVVNIQSDEPLITPAILARFAREFANSDRRMGTIVAPASPTDLDDPSAVKVVIDRSGDALYFSRAKIPFDRDGAGWEGYLKHIGIYAFETSALLEFAELPRMPLESAEKLEQLRALEHGWKIFCIEIADAARLIGVDTQDDIARVEAVLRGRGE